MLPEIEKLLALQERDSRIRALEAELAAIPSEIESKRKQIAASAARLEASKTRMRQIEVDRKSLELEADAKREQIARYKKQQFETRKNEEYAALGHEIASAEGVIASLEDRELELMVEADSLKPQIDAAETAHAAEKSELESQIKALEGARAEIAKRSEELASTRGSLAEGIDPDVLDIYGRLFKSKGGAALVELDGEICAGCHVKVTTQTVLAVRSEKSVVHCPNCGRILFLPQ